MRFLVLIFVLGPLFTLPLWSGDEGLIDFSAAKTFDAPVRDHSIIVADEGFYPDRISAFAGEKIRFFVTSTRKEPSCFLLEQKELFLGAKKGEIAEGIAYFKSPGTYKFHCPNGKIEGKITILPKKNKAERKIASPKRPVIWRPRDYPAGY